MGLVGRTSRSDLGRMQPLAEWSPLTTALSVSQSDVDIRGSVSLAPAGTQAVRLAAAYPAPSRQ